MCGIWVLLGQLRSEHHAEFLKIVGRGPDLTVLDEFKPNAWLGFHRLAIVEPGDQASEQPIVHGGAGVVCNGEIYNHLAIKADSGVDELVVLNGGSDCAAILHAFRKHKGDLSATCADLDGVFAFAMLDDEFLYLGRDPIGVRPLFYGFSDQGDLLAGSEVKSIEKLCRSVNYFPPGCCATVPINNARLLDIKQYYSLPTIPDRRLSVHNAQTAVRQTLIQAVKKRLMADRRFGFMLSGGLDSSLIASIATKFLNPDAPKPVAFSVGFIDSPDLVNAAAVARYLDIPHEILVITPEDCVKVVPEVVYALETFDPFVIRCGIPHYLLCKHIAATSDVKVLLSGEGADELFGSYAYMQRAPNPQHLHREIVRRLKLLHHYDVLRCDRATSCHGIEIRVPFLDKKFIDLAARLPAQCKLMHDAMEKFVLRSAFEGWLPEQVLWRSKEGFSEALGKSDLGEMIAEHVAHVISDDQFADRATRFPNKRPETKEEYWYRMIFERCYNFHKLAPVLHTKVYRTAAWQLPEEKENSKDSLLVVDHLPIRSRRRSTGSYSVPVTA